MRYGEPRSAGARSAVVYQPLTSGFGPAAGSAAHDPMLGCPVHELRTKLREAGLRPTRQRVALGWLLFAKGDRHITAEMLFEEATGSRVRISLATVYNTLHQFTEAGLLREIAVEGPKTYFDTKTCRPSPFPHRRIEPARSTFRRPLSKSSVCRKSPRAWKSPGSMWWCGCARSPRLEPAALEHDPGESPTFRNGSCAETERGIRSADAIGTMRFYSIFSFG